MCRKAIENYTEDKKFFTPLLVSLVQGWYVNQTGTIKGMVLDNKKSPYETLETSIKCTVYVVFNILNINLYMLICVNM